LKNSNSLKQKTDKDLRIVIVGAEQSKWVPEKEKRVRQIITKIMESYSEALFISGDCPKGGVDQWVREIALGLNKRFKSFPPKKNSWYWYKKRNKKMAEEASFVFDLEPYGNWSGGTWTLEYAKSIGKNGIKIRF